MGAEVALRRCFVLLEMSSRRPEGDNIYNISANLPIFLSLLLT